jgi:hypothetical protein
LVDTINLILRHNFYLLLLLMNTGFQSPREKALTCVADPATCNEFMHKYPSIIAPNIVELACTLVINRGGSGTKGEDDKSLFMSIHTGGAIGMGTRCVMGMVTAIGIAELIKLSLVGSQGQNTNS